MNAHVVCQLNSPGNGAVRNRFEWNVNGMVIASFEADVGTIYQVEADIPENSYVRLDAASIGSDGQMTWTNSDTLYTGTAPTPAPTPAPGAPSLGSLSIAYWS